MPTAVNTLKVRPEMMRLTEKWSNADLIAAAIVEMRAIEGAGEYGLSRRDAHKHARAAREYIQLLGVRGEQLALF